MGHPPHPADVLILTAASSWAALVWRKGTERPTRAGHYLTKHRGVYRRLYFNRGIWFSIPDKASADTPDRWLDGSDSLPEATDEG